MFFSHYNLFKNTFEYITIKSDRIARKPIDKSNREGPVGVVSSKVLAE